jgi:transketolase
MEELSFKKIQELELTANSIRESIILMLLAAGSGHTAGPLGMADIFTVLYFHTLKHKPHDPLWDDRDRLVLSNGHICPVLYATMAHAGYFPLKELETLRRFGSRLQGHPHREFMPWLENSSGPLGSGLSQALGMALADRIDQGLHTNKTIYALLSDGEHDEGNTWEAILLAGKEKTGNLIAIVDRNFIQIDGSTEDVLPLGDLGEKYASCGWHAQEIDGHNIKEIEHALRNAKETRNMPSVIIARTIPGKGVHAFEGDYTWHGKTPNKEEADRALAELRTLGGKIQSEHQ